MEVTRSMIKYQLRALAAVDNKLVFGTDFTLVLESFILAEDLYMRQPYDSYA